MNNITRTALHRIGRNPADSENIHKTHLHVLRKMGFIVQMGHGHFVLTQQGAEALRGNGRHITDE